MEIFLSVIGRMSKALMSTGFSVRDSTFFQNFYTNVEASTSQVKCLLVDRKAF